MKEDAELGSTVFAHVELADPDSSGQTIEVECINLPGYEHACDLFQLQQLDASTNSYKGVFTLTGKLNYTVRDEYEMLLKATVSISSTHTLGGNPGLHSTISCHLTPFILVHRASVQSISIYYAGSIWDVFKESNFVQIAFIYIRRLRAN